MSYLDIKYLGLLSSRLERYSVKSTYPLEVNFRCPYCGDSKVSTFKARGWILTIPQRDAHYYYCHNCFMKVGFLKFLKDQDSGLAKDYVKEIMMERFGKRKERVSVLEEPKPAVTLKIEKPDLRSVSSLDDMHPAKEYMISRQLPEGSLDRCFFVPKFKEWVMKIKPDAFDEAVKKSKDEPRIVFPMYSMDGKTLIGVIGRSYLPDSRLRYMTIMFQDVEKVYGLERVDPKSTVYLLEGAIDSLFVENSLAKAGVGDLSLPGFSDLVYVLDNEPRNIHVVRKMMSLAKQKQKIVIWPNHIVGKDINKMVLDGELSASEVTDFLRANTHTGLMATSMISRWKRC